MIDHSSATRVSLVLNMATFLIALLVFMTVCAYISPPYTVLFLFLLLCAIWCEHKERFLPRFVLTMASVGAIGLFSYRARLSDLAPQTVETLLFLLAIKLLERKAFRDYMQIYILSVLLVAGSALFGLSLVFLSYVIVLTFLFNAAMILAAYHHEDPKMLLSLRAIEKMLWKASLIPLCAIPLGALIFVITPRTPFPLLDFLNRGSHSTSGFSDQIRLGKVSDIQEDESIIFRAAMEKVPEEALYWRGIVLDQFDGAVWKSHRRRMVAAGTDKPIPPYVPVWQEIYLEPYGNTYLFALDRPSLLLLRSVREYGDGTFSSDEIINRRIRYRAASTLRGPWVSEETDPRVYLQLPSGLSDSVRALARSLRSDKGPEATLASLSRFLRDKGFSYSLTGLPVTDVPLDDFLFRRKSGNCEYFASAFATLARANGIPSRLVAGYRGGLYNELGKYYLVSQKHAHVWVEAHLADRGWVRYDPTPASGSDGQRLRQDIFLKAGLYLDMVNYYWVAFVVNYDVQKQFALFMGARTVLGEGGSRIGDIPGKRLLLLFVCAGGILLGVLRIGKELRRSDVEKLSSFLLKRLEKQGYTKKPSQGLEEFAGKIEDEKLREEALQVIRAFEDTYYRDEGFSRDQIKGLRKRIRGLQRSRSDA